MTQKRVEFTTYQQEDKDDDCWVVDSPISPSKRGNGKQDGHDGGAQRDRINNSP